MDLFSMTPLLPPLVTVVATRVAATVTAHYQWVVASKFLTASRVWVKCWLEDTRRPPWQPTMVFVARNAFLLPLATVKGGCGRVVVFVFEC